jgi:Amt family ammonium transporter
LSASAACYAFIAGAKHRLRLDDSLDVFGIHGLGGIIGSIGTAVAALPLLGGHGGEHYEFGSQLARQLGAVLLAGAWSAAGSAICFSLTRALIPLRPGADEEREGLDLSDHGERAYNP